MHRLKECKISNWHRIGRMKRSDWPKTFNRPGVSYGEKQIVAGRLICDLANDLGRVCLAYYSFSLEANGLVPDQGSNMDPYRVVCFAAWHKAVGNGQ